MRKGEGGNGRIYKSHRTLKMIISLCVGAIVFFLVLTIFVYFYFQRYIVYLPDGSGLRLVVPWLTGETTDGDLTYGGATSADITVPGE